MLKQIAHLWLRKPKQVLAIFLRNWPKNFHFPIQVYSNIGQSALLALAFLLLGSPLAQAQTWLLDHPDIYTANDPDGETINVPNEQVYLGLIGATGGKEIDSHSGSTFPGEGFISTLRSFHLMEHDFSYGGNLDDGYYPRDGKLKPANCDCDVPNVWDPACTNNVPENLFEGSPGVGSRMQPWKTTYCRWKDDYFIDETYASIEAIKIPDAPEGEVGGTQGWPDKWYQKEHWGANSTERIKNAKNYAISFAQSYASTNSSQDQVVDVLEVGNEPWGENSPGVMGYHDILQGVIDGFTQYYGSSDPDNWKIKLSTAAFDVTNNTCSGADHTLIDDMLPVQFRPYMSYVSIHNYAKRGPFSCTPEPGPHPQRYYAPESPNGRFLKLKNMRKWMDKNGMQHAKLNITEFGWNSAPNTPCYGVGQGNQAAYTVRAFLLASRFGVHKGFNYKYYDPSPSNYEGKSYCTTGFIDNDDVVKKAHTALKKFNSGSSNGFDGFGDKRFLTALTEGYQSEGQRFAYIIGNAAGEPTHLVAWKADDLGENGESYPTPTSSYAAIELPEQLSVANGDRYYYLGWDNSQDGEVGPGQRMRLNSGELEIRLSGMPIVVALNNPTGCVYNADGTTNCGTSVENLCDNINISNTSNSITITGQATAPVNQIWIYNLDNGWQVEYSCTNCDPTVTVPLSNGHYRVRVKLYTQEWQSICEEIQDVTIDGTSNPCDGQGGDTDGDGICDDNDNCINVVNPNQTDTDNDGQGDACESNESPCDNVGINANGNTISISNLDAAPIAQAWIYDLTNGWTVVFSCTNCPANVTETLPNGNYRVRVKFYTSTWQSICETIQDLTLDGGIGPDPCSGQGGDIDGDEVCGNADNCPSIYNPDQANVCNSNTACDNVGIAVSPNTITVSGITTAAPNFKIKLYNASWSLLFECTNSCPEPTVLDNLSPGDYHLQIRLMTSGWSTICSPTYDITIAGVNPLVQQDAGYTAANEYDNKSAHATERDQAAASLSLVKNAEVQLESMYPNPATDLLMLNINSRSESTQQISVYNAYGKRVMSDRIAMQKGKTLHQLSLSDLPQGIYYLDLSGTKLQNANRSFVKI